MAKRYFVLFIFLFFFILDLRLLSVNNNYSLRYSPETYTVFCKLKSMGDNSSPIFSQQEFWNYSDIEKNCFWKDSCGFIVPQNINSVDLESKSKYNYSEDRLYVYGVSLERLLNNGWLSGEDCEKKKVTLCTIIKLAWEKYHAIPIITWGLESPYVPHSYKNILGRTYHSGRKLEYAFPSVHNDIISEILNNTYIADNKPQYDSEGYWIPNNSTRCGVGRYNSSDSEGYPSPYEWFNAKCQEVADLINSLVAQDGTHIPVIFRLWHECEAKHFWWGGGNKQKYKDFYIYTVEKFRQLCPYKNILFGYCRDKYWSTEQSYLDRYPGDDYVDVMGFDNYSIGLSDSDTAKAILQMQIITKLARKHNKIPVLFETGNKQDVLKTKYLLSDVLYKCLKSKGVGLSICQIWSTFEIKNQINIDDYISFLGKDDIITTKNNIW